MIEIYKISQSDRGGIGFWINIFLAEDMWYKYIDKKQEYNNNRKLRLTFHIELLRWFIIFKIPLKRVGTTYYGRKMKE